MRKNVKIIIEYDGTDYHGWQCQGDLPTVQKTIEDALRQITGESVKITGSGRTDTGVHAMGQVASFLTDTQLDSETLRKALNSTLPRDISIIRAQEVPQDFHAQFSSRSKVYEYRIFNRPNPPALQRNRVWHIPEKLDMGKMKEAISHLEGDHDFSVFATADITVKTTVRTVKEVHVRKNREGIILIEIEANGFLKRMVRMITGTLVEVGKGKLSPEGFGQILAEGKKTKNVFTAPPSGLFLKKVIY
ncbi:MAG: tRNA pseudouridine(38-40) synthase TruA [Candidatus Dadabacteria bacterium]|nr:tRNA pseudouridine(38-40) synthase TruA [Candidatus Dadabacteria bacterium]MDE0663256.1 tRNA pseudouridine(38-40) synthase TruA [Candidatus Dadabacteria bacterium]